MRISRCASPASSSDRAINRIGRGKKLENQRIDDSEGIREDGADRNEDPALRVSCGIESAFRRKPFQPALPRLFIQSIVSYLAIFYLRLP